MLTGLVTGVAVGTATITATATSGATTRTATSVITVTATTTPPDGAALYGSNCASCHNPLATSSKKGRTAAQTQNAINNNTGGMGTSSLRSLTSAQVAAIATALATTAPVLSSVSVTPSTASIIPTGTQQLTASPLDQNGAPFAGATITWSSGNTPVATVSATGLVTGVAVGTATITATATSGATTKTATSVITVTSVATPPDGATLYASNCASCHGPLASSTKAGRTAAQTQNAINNNIGGMGTSSLRSLTTAQVAAIATVLGQQTPPPPLPPTPITDGPTLYGNYCGSCHGPLASSTKKGTTAAQIQAAINSTRAAWEA